MPFCYQSGEEIRKADRVTYHGEPAEIEFVADKLMGDPALDWFVRGHGGGVMIAGAKSFGHVFVHDAKNDEDLIFVARKESP